MKQIFTSLIALVFITSAYAQYDAPDRKDEKDDKKKFLEWLFFDADLGGSRFYGKDEKDSKFGFYYDAGLGVRIQTCNHFYLDPEIGYRRITSKFSNQTADYKYMLGYIYIDLDGEYNIPQSKLSIETGPRFSFLTSAEGKLTYNGQTQNIDQKPYFKKTDFGWNIGADLMITRHFCVGTHEYFGITNISNSGGSGRDLSLSVGLRYMF